MQSFTKDTLEAGQPARIDCLELEGQVYTISRSLLTEVRLEEEWYEDVRDPAQIVDALSAGAIGADLFTFWQRIPDTERRFDYHTEWEDLAVLPLSTVDHWWDHQIKSRTRNLIRKSEKLGVDVRRAVYDDDFVRGMTAIFNETPVRQERRFWHYGKDVETVREQFSRFLFREELIGAYYQGEMIGFMMLANAGQFALTGQILSMVAHRDKATNNALIAKAVEVCVERGWPHLVYLHWGTGSFSEFKRRCGFEKMRVPRYYVPLSAKGRLALKLGLHRGWRECLPSFVKQSAKDLRSRWLNYRFPESAT